MKALGGDFLWSWTKGLRTLGCFRSHSPFGTCRSNNIWGLAFDFITLNLCSAQLKHDKPVHLEFYQSGLELGCSGVQMW